MMIGMKKVTANGLTFMTGSKGQGPRLLFITGTGCDLRHSDTPLTSSLTSEFQVLSYDQRGMGQTDKPDGPYSMRGYAEDAVAVLDAYGWEEALVVGYSFGGMVAQELAIGWPERVQRLVLLVTTAGGEGGSSYPLHALFDLPLEERARRTIEISDLTFTPEWQAAHPLAAAERVNGFVADECLATDPESLSGAKHQLQARAQHDTYERLPSITMPTLVIAAKDDGLAPLPAQQAMAEAIPQAKFEVFAGAHSMLWDSDEVFQRIACFMREGGANDVC